MRYLERLGNSFSGVWKNLSLLGALLLGYVLYVLISVFFVLVQAGLLTLLNPGVTDPTALLNAKTIVALVLVTLAKMFLIIYAASFFLAGFYGMVRNKLQDGTTTFKEFFPNAKRHWSQIFRFLWLPFLILYAFSLPLLYFNMVSDLVLQYGAVQSMTLSVLLFASLLLLLIAGILVQFFFSYGPAIIVFDDTPAWSSTKESFRLAWRNKGKTLGVTGTVLLAVGVITLLSVALLVLLPQENPWVLLAIKLLSDMFIIIAAIFSMLFVFYTYLDLTTHTVVRKHPVVTKPTTTPLKRKK